MNYYRFSDLTISMTCRYDIMKRRAEKYLIPKAKENELSETTTPEIRLNPKNELIQKYQEKYPHLTLDEAELILLSSHFSLELIKHQGFVLHASAISYNDKAVLFSADSGVGKSTHTRLWQNHFGKNNVHIINDDKPALRLFGNSFTVYGTPFSGNSDENENIKAPLHAVVFLEQCEHNAMKKLTAKEALPYFLYNLPQYSKHAERMNTLLSLLDILLKTTPVYLLSCTVSYISAAIPAFPPAAAYLPEYEIFAGAFSAFNVTASR